MEFVPFIMREEAEFRRESVWGDSVRVTAAISAASDDGSHWTWQHDFMRDDRLLARVRQTGGWLNMADRTMIAPPDEVWSRFRTVFAADHEQLPSLIAKADD